MVPADYGTAREGVDIGAGPGLRADECPMRILQAQAGNRHPCAGRLGSKSKVAVRLDSDQGPWPKGRRDHPSHTASFFATATFFSATYAGTPSRP